ncbi:hypothetical protein ASC75_05190 [Aminobacter sp. DSM 101952]|nr:hypothetical protein ASC75_05190 [Aminobacter sp. DSM 101952]
MSRDRARTCSNFQYFLSSSNHPEHASWCYIAAQINIVFVFVRRFAIAFGHIDQSYDVVQFVCWSGSAVDWFLSNMTFVRFAKEAHSDI